MTLKHKSLSIIIPMFNNGQYISKCLDSILVQIPSHTEIIIVDNGSTDEGPRVSREYQKNNSQIRIIHSSENKGLSWARNIGAAHALNDFLLFIDGDDFIESSALQKCLQILDKQESDAVIFTYSKISNDEKKIDLDLEYKTFPDSGVKSSHEALRYLMQDRIQNFVWRIIFPRETWIQNEISFPEGKFFEDISTTYKIISSVSSIYFLNESLYFYRQHPGSIMHSLDRHHLEDLIQASIQRSADVRKIDSSLEELCDAQEYKAYYRVVSITLRSPLSSEAQIYVDSAVKYLSDHKPPTGYRKIFNKKQRLVLLSLRHNFYKTLKFLM